MARPRDERQKDLLKPALDQIINLGHPMVRLAGLIDWDFLHTRFSSVCIPGAGQPPLPSRLVAGLFILKHMHNLSDEVLCARWVENPYYQFFCGEESFQHAAPFDRSSLTRWRQRLGEEQLVALIQESLSAAHKTGAMASKDLERVVVDTTVQPKAIAHPTDARLMHRALEKLVALAKDAGLPLRQSYARVAKRAAIMVGRYSHAHQFKRARRALKFLRTRLGRIIRDIHRKIAGDDALKARFGPLLDLALRVRFQDHRQRGHKVYALHAPEVECIGKGKARAPYEFGCKVSVATPPHPAQGRPVCPSCAGGARQSRSLSPGRPEAGPGGWAHSRPGRRQDREADRCRDPPHSRRQELAPAKAGGYRGHNHPHKFRVWISGQVRRVTKTIRREMKRRAAVEPVIGHLKAEHRLGRNYLKGRDGDRINAVLAAAGYNFSLLLRWLETLLRALITMLVNSDLRTQIA